MKRIEILMKIQEIFQEVLDEETIELTEDTIYDDIEEWDSLTHMQLIVAIEKTFNIKFSSIELISSKNIRAIIDFVSSKI